MPNLEYNNPLFKINNMSHISGEILPRNKHEDALFETLPSVIIEDDVEHESVEGNSVAIDSDSLSEETEGSLLVMLEAVDDELKRVKTRLRSTQETAIKYSANNEILAKLNEESKFFQRQFDELLAKKDVILAKIRQLRSSNQAA